jgi:hypothetical protein
MNARKKRAGVKRSYTLVFSLLALVDTGWAIDLIDHKPIPELVAALKAAGHERIAQGSQDIVAKDTSTGEIFTARAPLMLTTNKQTGEWTISVFNTKETGSVLLIGTRLQHLTFGAVSALPTFDRQKAGQVISKFDGWGPGYYPDEIARYSTLGFHRIFTGQITAIAEPLFRNAMKPVFFDVIFCEKDAGFSVLVVDQSGACAKLAFGSAFSDKP